MCFVFMSISYGSLPDVETQHFEKEASVSFYYSLNLKLPQFSANGTYSSFNKIVDSIAEKNKATFFSQAIFYARCVLFWLGAQHRCEKD